MGFPEIDPVALQLGPLSIHWYGVSYALSMGLGWWLLAWRTRQSEAPLRPEQLADLVFFVMVGILIGGRLGSVLFYHIDDLRQDVWLPLRIWQGGMSFHGGLLGVLVAFHSFAHRHRLPYAALSDFVAPVIPVGLFLGRIANFINGELWGKPTDLPWGVVFPSPLAGGVPRHPSQLYEAALEGLVLFCILWWYTSRPRPAWAASGLFLACYGGMRCLVESVREPDRHMGYIAWGWMTMGQALSLPMLLAGVLLLVWSSRAPARA